MIALQRRRTPPQARRGRTATRSRSKAFRAPLADLATIGYRQELMRDLDDAAVLACVEAFAERMRVMRQYLGLVEKRRFLCAVDVDVEAVQQLAQALRQFELRSHGLYASGRPDARFLRAERLADGTRTFRVVPGEPLDTGYGRDLFDAVFAGAPG